VAIVANLACHMSISDKLGVDQLELGKPHLLKISWMSLSAQNKSYLIRSSISLNLVSVFITDISNELIYSG